MNKIEKKDFLIFGLSSSKKLAEKIAAYLGVELGDSEYKIFADEELLVKIHKSVRGKKIFLIQSTNKPANTKIMELLINIDALRRSSAKEINVIMPYYGYSRQDKKTHARQSITAALIARLLEEAGATRVLSFDLHSTQIQGFYKIPFDELKAYGILAKAIRKNFDTDNFVVISPDNGGMSRTRLLAEVLSAPSAFIDKRRDVNTGEVTSFNVLGDVKGKDCVIYDDIVDTGGTIIEAYQLLKEKGAKDVYVVCTHALLSPTESRPDVLEVLKEMGVKKFIATNSVSSEQIKKHRNENFYEEIDLSEAIADVINKMLLEESVTDYFIEKYNKKNI